MNGFSLTRDDHSASYAIIRHNVRTYRSDGVVEVVRGKQNAESELKKIEESQRDPDRHEGWRYFIEKTDLKAGIDPTEATCRRQAELEVRESKEMQETKPPFTPPASSQR
ncbi:MAG: hypothetical protein WAL71_03475 [Terriglobales bacterium]